MNKYVVTYIDDAKPDTFEATSYNDYGIEGCLSFWRDGTCDHEKNALLASVRKTLVRSVRLVTD